MQPVDAGNGGPHASARFVHWLRTAGVVGLLLSAACAAPGEQSTPRVATAPSRAPAAGASSPEPAPRTLTELVSIWKGLDPEDEDAQRAFCAEVVREPTDSFARGTLASLGNGAALLVTLVEGCGGDSCGARGWIRTQSMRDFRELPIDAGGTVEASPDAAALYYDEVTSAAVPGGSDHDPFGGTEPVITMRLALPSFDRAPFAPCFSARLSPSGKWILCRDRAANVLRVPVDGGTPERWAFSGRRSDEVEIVPHAHRWPAPVKFPSPTTVTYSIPLDPSALGSPTGVEVHTVPWSDGPLAEMWEIRFADHYPEHHVLSLREWLREHRVAGPEYEQRCWELGERVGIPPAPGLLCLARTRDPLTYAHVYRREGARLRQVFEAIVATYANWLELVPLLLEDGSLRLADASPQHCWTAFAEASAKANADLAPPAAQFIPRACRQLGLYRYERGQYRLDPSTRPPFDPLPEPDPPR